MNKYDIEPRYATSAVEEALGKRLGFKYTGQDWEIVNGDPSRLEEFLLIYEQEPLDEDQRFALMELIVASYEELACEQPDNAIWERIRKHLCDRFSLHAYTVECWALSDASYDEDRQGWHAITPQMREIMHQFLGPRENWPTAGFAIWRFCEPIGNEKPILLNGIEIGAHRNGRGFYAIWSKIPGRESGKRTFATAGEAMRWAEAEFGVKRDQWKDV